MKKYFFVILFSIWISGSSSAARAQSYGMPPDTITVLVDSLAKCSKGLVTGGQFLPLGGWEVSSDSAMIFYDLETYISSGSLEITVTHFDPKKQNSFRRHHVLSMYTNHWGEHHQIELLDTDWNLHTGFNYLNGIKIQSATYEDDRLVVVPWDSLPWDLNRSYRLKFVWKKDSLLFSRDDSLICVTGHTHNFLLRYIYLGRDRTISGDYLTQFHHQQYPAMVGPIFSNLVVKKFLSKADVKIPQVQKFFVSEIYANAAKLKWQFSFTTISKLIYKQIDSMDWDSTSFFEIPRKNYEYTLSGLDKGKKYEAKVVFKNDLGERLNSFPIYFKTRTTNFYLFKPFQDAFVEDEGLIGPNRNIANMGWLYLMVGKGRRSFLQFPPELSQETVRKASLNLHIRNKRGNIRQLYLREIEDEWNENSITWETQPNIGDTSFLAVVDSQFYRGDWITFPVTSRNSVKNGLNIAITTPDSGWFSLDSKDSYDAQPELIIDYRSTYILNGQTSFSGKIPLSNVSVMIQPVGSSALMCPVDTIITDANGYFEKSLKLGNVYRLSFKKESQKNDIKAISIYDAYLSAAMSIGLIQGTRKSILAADANGDNKVTIYDALLIAKTAVGLDTGGFVGKWRFEKLPNLANEIEDSISIAGKGVIVGDVDFSWPNKAYSNYAHDLTQRELIQIDENDSSAIVYFTNFEMRRVGSFYINFSYDPNNLEFSGVHWPASMETWSIFQNIHNGSIKIGGFSPEKSDVNFDDFKLFFLKREKAKNFKIVIRQIQLDTWIAHNIIVDGVEEESQEKLDDFLSIFPNPFNLSTRIEAAVSKSSRANLFIFNALGQLVFSKKLFSNNGYYSFIWKGENNQNVLVPSGIYYVKLKTEEKIYGQKILFLK